MQQPDIPQNEIALKSDCSQWLALDDAAEWNAFSEQVNPNEWESRLAIEGMHCAACGFAVESALRSLNGVISAEVNATSGRARVVWTDKVTKPSQLMRAVNKAGYQAFPQSLSEDLRRKQQRLLMWRWLVAGFCMMQVMMYAYPAYSSSASDMTNEMSNLLRWASWVLTLPVMLFSSGPFFSNAIHDLKQRQISMDLPVALAILITFCVSSAGTFEPSGWWGKEVYFDSLTMFVFFLLTGRWLEGRMRDRTAGALETLMRRLPVSIERQKSDGDFERVAVRRLQVGDVLRVYPGEAFPADGILISGNTTADEALLTGESRPVTKKTGANVIAGSHNLSSVVNMRVEQIGAATQYAQIIALMERASVDKPRLALLADKIAKPFLVIVLLSAAGSALLLWETDHAKAIMAAVAVLIVTCPCALSLATPAAMLASAGTLARNGLLARRLQALEAIATADTIIFDKTGTLTNDRIKVAEIDIGEQINEREALKLAAAIAKFSLHPASRSLVSAWEENSNGSQDAETISDVSEIAGAGLVAMSRLGVVRLGSAKHCDIKMNASDSMQVHMVNAQGRLATFTLEEEIRSDAKSAVKSLAKQGLNIVMLSGDRASATESVAHKLGINNYLAECTPKNKLAYMQVMQQKGGKIVMVGDGLNDGPVLAGAQVSVAIGQAVPLAQAQSDFIIQSGQLGLLPKLIDQARKTMRIVKQNLVWAAIYNAVCIPLAVLGYLPAWLAGLGMAMSSLIVVLNALRLSRNVVFQKQLA